MRFLQYVNEGARAGDLEYLVSQFVSIDQYSTKIASDNIVVSFFVKDKEPAHDLEEFISKNYFDAIVDIEISQSKTINGDYQIFIEFKRTPAFPARLMNVLNGVQLLSNNDKWVFKTLNLKDTKDLTEANIKKYVRLTPEKKPKTDYIDVVIYGKMYHFDKVEISRYTFEKAISNSDTGLNDAPTIEYIEISKQFPAYEVSMIDGEIYLIKDEHYYKLIPVTTPLSDD